MIFYYRVSGVIADVALILNIVLTLATLALFRATLTLPGIAGLVLSVGMAVDANILIHERIKRRVDGGERRLVQPLIKAIIGPLSPSSIPIDHVNRRVLLYHWDRSCEGFAVTLCIGILPISSRRFMSQGGFSILLLLNWESRN